MEKQTKVAYWLIVTFIIGSILHNLLSGLLGVEEPFFFFIGIGGGLGFLISFIYLISTYLKNGQPRDLWKLGFLGFLGMLGVIPQFGPRFFGLFGFFSLFWLRKN